MINNLDEQRLSTSVKKTVKVRSFPGSTFEQMYKNVGPLLKKKPDVIFLHVGTNDAVKKTSDIIIDDISRLKHFIELQLPDTKIIISCPIMRTDDAKASLTIKHIISKMKFTMVDSFLNDNVSFVCLGRKGLHLNSKGVGRLAAVNLLSRMRRL